MTYLGCGNIYLSFSKSYLVTLLKYESFLGLSYNFNPKKYKSNTKNLIKILENYIDNI